MKISRSGNGENIMLQYSKFHSYVAVSEEEILALSKFLVNEAEEKIKAHKASGIVKPKPFNTGWRMNANPEPEWIVLKASYGNDERIPGIPAPQRGQVNWCPGMLCGQSIALPLGGKWVGPFVIEKIKTGWCSADDRVHIVTVNPRILSDDEIDRTDTEILKLGTEVAEARKTLDRLVAKLSSLERSSGRVG